MQTPREFVYQQIHVLQVFRNNTIERLNGKYTA